MLSNSIIGVLGAGSFGTAIANILADNHQVLMYARRPEVVDAIQHKRLHRNQTIHPRIQATISAEEVCQRCTLIYVMVDSGGFRELIRQIDPFLRPYHVLIHGTKGLHVVLPDINNDWTSAETLSRSNIRTMSEVILEESEVLRIGALSGPNLSGELAARQPAATVISSRFDEVIEYGKNTLRSNRFRVYGSHDVLGVEMAGVLKNIYAIVSGILSGMQMGENSRAMIMSRGLGEMVRLGRALGSKTSAFYGIAGIGDLIATCSSSRSRNFTVGYRLSQGETLHHILETMDEVAEGVKTTKIAHCLSRYYHLDLPIIANLHGILYENLPIHEAFNNLMHHENDVDADFLVNEEEMKV